jgi:YidC/Oxa1 family membrane protein insertase
MAVLVAGPQMERAQRNAEIAAEQAARDASYYPATTIADGTVCGDGRGGNRTRRPRRAVAATERVAIETAASKARSASPARLDDLRLKKYTETVDPAARSSRFASGAPAGYYVEQGWAPANGSTS